MKINTKALSKAIATALQAPPQAVTPEFAGIVIAAGNGRLFIGSGTQYLYRAVAVPVEDSIDIAPVVTDHALLRNVVEAMKSKSSEVTIDYADNALIIQGQGKSKRMQAKVAIWGEASFLFIKEMLRVAIGGAFMRDKLNGRQSLSLPVSMRPFVGCTEKGDLSKLTSVHLAHDGDNAIIAATDSMRGLCYGTSPQLPPMTGITSIAIDKKAALLLNSGVVYLPHGDESDSIGKCVLVVSVDEDMTVATAILPNEWHAMNADALTGLFVRELPEPRAIIHADTKEAMKALSDSMVSLAKMSGKSTKVEVMMRVMPDKLTFVTDVFTGEAAGQDMQAEEELVLEGTGIVVEGDEVTFKYNPALLESIIGAMDMATFTVNEHFTRIEGEKDEQTLYGVIAGIWKV